MPSFTAASNLVSHSPFFSADRYARIPRTRRKEVTRFAVHVLPCPVGNLMRFNVAAMSSSDQRVAMVLITATASSIVLYINSVLALRDTLNLRDARRKIAIWQREYNCGPYYPTSLCA